MTREEAIEALKIDIHNAKVARHQFEQYDMAIQALEQTELKSSYNSIKTELNDDAISRQAVRDMLKDINADTDGVGFYYEHYDEYIKNLPSVSTEKTGRFEWNQYDYNPNLGNWHCSECRSVVIECVDKNKKGSIPLYKYCPQCGAKMIELQESEESE